MEQPIQKSLEAEIEELRAKLLASARAVLAAGEISIGTWIPLSEFIGAMVSIQGFAHAKQLQDYVDILKLANGSIQH